jgi:hypothetical protein
MTKFHLLAGDDVSRNRLVKDGYLLLQTGKERETILSSSTHTSLSS